MVVDAIPAVPRRQERLRRLMDSLLNKRNDQLDDTGYNRRRRAGDEYGTPEQRPSGGINVPSTAIFGLLSWLFIQAAGGIWWAATMQSNASHAETDRAREEQRLWETINQYHAEINALRVDIARVQGAQSGSQAK